MSIWSYPSYLLGQFRSWIMSNRPGFPSGYAQHLWVFLLAQLWSLLWEEFKKLSPGWDLTRIGKRTWYYVVSGHFEIFLLFFLSILFWFEGIWSTVFYFSNFIGPSIAGTLVQHFGFRTTTSIFPIIYVINLLINSIEFLMFRNRTEYAILWIKKWLTNKICIHFKISSFNVRGLLLRINDRFREFFTKRCVTCNPIQTARKYAKIDLKCQYFDFWIWKCSRER